MREISEINPVPLARIRTMTVKKHSASGIRLEARVTGDKDLPDALMKEAL